MMQSQEFKANVNALKCASDLTWALGIAIGTKSSAALMTACSEIYGMGRRLLAADAQALADVRTLDNCGMRHATVDYRGPGTPDENAEERWRCEVGTQAAFDGPTPEAARAKAAAWVREQAK